MELARLADGPAGQDGHRARRTCRSTAGGRTLLDHVSWQLGPGDRVGIVGVNGTGKTTLLRLLAGTLPVPSAGEVAHDRSAW